MGFPVKVRGKDGYRDVEFEGLMCSAQSDPENNPNERVYFTIDEDGIALDSYKPNLLGAAKSSKVSFSVKNKKTKTAQRDWAFYPDEEDGFDYQNYPDEEDSFDQRPNPVEVVRYFRSWDNDLDAWSNMGGLTIICILDYEDLVMNVYPSFCSHEENFEKDVGYAVACYRMNANTGIKLRFNRELSIRENITKALTIDCNWDYTSNDQKENAKLESLFSMCMYPSVDGRFESIF